jgi:hypothetical protein
MFTARPWHVGGGLSIMTPLRLGSYVLAMRNRTPAAAFFPQEVRAFAVDLLADQRVACRADAELRGPLWEREVGFMDAGSPSTASIRRSRARADTSLFIAPVGTDKSLAWLPGRLFCGTATEGLVILPRTLALGRDSRFAALGSGWRPSSPPAADAERLRYWIAIWRDLADVCHCLAVYERTAEANGWRSNSSARHFHAHRFEKLAKDRVGAWQLLAKWCSRTERALRHGLNGVPGKIPLSIEGHVGIARRAIPTSERAAAAESNPL